MIRLSDWYSVIPARLRDTGYGMWRMSGQVPRASRELHLRENVLFTGKKATGNGLIIRLSKPKINPGGRPRFV